MANTDLFKEAIADAKAIRETAIANAKAALEESFTPAIKDMLRAKLEEMEAEEEEVSEMMHDKYEEDDLDEGYGSKYEEDDTMAEMEEEELEEVETIDEEEIDLDELVASVQESDEETLNEQEEEEEEMESEEEVEVEDEPEEGEEEMEMDDEEEIDLENLTVDELEDLIKDVIEDMMEAGEIEMESDEEESLEDVEDMEGEESEEEDMEVELEEILSELKSYYEEDDKGMEEGKKEEIEEYAGIGVDVSQIEGILALLAGTVGLPLAVLASSYAKEGMAGLKRLLAKAGKKMEGELNEAISTINQLRSDLHEVNLLNSKLLYTNKIFKDKNLSEEIKLKVVEAFDKAKTAEEAKIVYETLKESISTKSNAKPIKENLGFASKPMGSNNVKQPIVETFDFKNRWQKLAGIK